MVLADYLTRRGLAVLRYDDRGVGQSTGRFDLATTADLADDAMAGVTFLHGRPEIDPGRIGIVGHSEGGMIAPMVASRSSQVAFIVLLAGPGIRLDELIVTQLGLFALADGASEAQVAALRAMSRVIHQAIVAEENRAAVYTAVSAYYNGLSDAEKGLLGWSRSTLNATIESRLTPWWRYFLTFDPAVYLEQVKCPVLALNGDQDLNVVAAENLAAIDRALTVAGNADYRVVQLPGLNHMLNGNGEVEPADTTRAIETINPEVLDLVSSWIREHAGLGPWGTAVEEHAITLPQATNLGRYLLSGGFLYAEVVAYNPRTSADMDIPALRNFIRIAFRQMGYGEGKDWKFVRLEQNHPRYHCFYDLGELPHGFRERISGLGRRSGSGSGTR